ncbi:MAG: DUF4832 domain-containing protein [Prolixibacteraceae bacterium]
MKRNKFIRLGSTAVLAGLTLPWQKTFGFAAGRDVITYTPPATDSVLVNPGMGFETFHSFNGDERDAPLENYPECSISYHRYYWDIMEPEEGKYNFELLDRIMEKCARHGQDLALRFMPLKPTLDRGVPAWFMKKGKGFPFVRNEKKGWSPDFNDPYYLDKWEQLNAVFGERYNGHKHMVRMEIGGYGFWGEWHISHTDLPPITEENAFKLVDMHFRHWDRVPLTMLTAMEPALIYALKKGAGWRVDSLGDYGHFSPTWSHMVNNYPNKIKRIPLMSEAYKNGPIAYEPPGKMVDLPNYVPSKGGGYENMWNTALEWHGSAYNPKSGKIPEEMVPSINDFLKKCGYRFVVRKAVVPDKVHLNDRIFPLKIDISNEGVAPLYRNYILAVRLRGGNEDIVLNTSANVKSWLPGEHTQEEVVMLPGKIPGGEYILSLGLLEPYNMKPAIWFANKGNDKDKWLPLEGRKIKILS